MPCELDFMAVSSYGSLTDSSGVVRILKDLDSSIEGKDVLIVEDIVDSGLTLNYLLRNLRGRKPRSLEVCALLVKPARRKIELPIRYVGFEIPNRFVVGYGLDLDQRYRNLPYVAALDGERGRRATCTPPERRSPGRRSRRAGRMPDIDPMIRRRKRPRNRAIRHKAPARLVRGRLAILRMPSFRG